MNALTRTERQDGINLAHVEVEIRKNMVGLELAEDGTYSNQPTDRTRSPVLTTKNIDV